MKQLCWLFPTDLLQFKEALCGAIKLTALSSTPTLLSICLSDDTPCTSNLHLILKTVEAGSKIAHLLSPDRRLILSFQC